jgi:hypothetical protein
LIRDAENGIVSKMVGRNRRREDKITKKRVENKTAKDDKEEEEKDKEKSPRRRRSRRIRMRRRTRRKGSRSST